MRSRQDSALALSDKSTAGNSEWMDEPSGTVPSVTADFMRKTFYPEDEHVADPAAASPTDRSCLCCWDSVGRALSEPPSHLIKLIDSLLYYFIHFFSALIDEDCFQGGKICCNDILTKKPPTSLCQVNFLF